MSTQIGLSNLHYALLTTDPKGGAPTYGAPVAFSGGAIQANINPNTNMETLFGDDGPMEVATSLGQVELEMIASDFTLEEQAILLGHTISGGVLHRKGSDVPPWVAIGFKTLKSNGKYRFIWLAKGKFSMPEMKHETKGDSISFQTPTLKGSFVKRDSDDEWIKQADEDSPSYVASIGTDWFNGVYAVDAVAPTVAIVPADGASNVAVSANIVFTFDKAIDVADVTAANFIVMKADGTAVAGAFSVDAAHQVVTFDPTVNMSAATQYIAIVNTNVKSLSGVHLAANNVSNFTTV